MEREEPEGREEKVFAGDLLFFRVNSPLHQEVSKTINKYKETNTTTNFLYSLGFLVKSVYSSSQLQINLQKLLSAQQ